MKIFTEEIDLKKSKKLIVGKKYWIFDGTMKPIKLTLTSFNNSRTTAIFNFSIPRKSSSVYVTKEEALKENRY